MKPIRKGELKSFISSAKVIRLDTGEIIELSTKGESYCHFFDPITIEDIKIIFRIDWSMLDAGGNPTLDADFYDIEKNIKLSKEGERYTAHHTETTDINVRVYEWRFREIRWPFKLLVSWILKAHDELQVSDFALCEVYRHQARE